MNKTNIGYFKFFAIKIVTSIPNLERGRIWLFYFKTNTKTYGLHPFPKSIIDMHHLICNGFYSYKLREVMCDIEYSHCRKNVNFVLCFTSSQPPQYLSLQYRPLFILSTRVPNAFHSCVCLSIHLSPPSRLFPPYFFEACYESTSYWRHGCKGELYLAQLPWVGWHFYKQTFCHEWLVTWVI